MSTQTWVENFRGVQINFLKAANGEPVAVGADIVELLKKTRQNSARVIENNVRCKWWVDLPNPNGGKPIRCLFEPGVYQLCSNPVFTTDFAEEFQDWVFEEVLPKLRASGGYIIPNATSEQLAALQNEISNLQSQIKSKDKTIYTLDCDRQFRREMYTLLQLMKVSHDDIDVILRNINYTDTELMQQFYLEVCKFINNDPIYDRARYGNRKLSKEKFITRWKANLNSVAS